MQWRADVQNSSPKDGVHSEKDGQGKFMAKKKITENNKTTSILENSLS